MTVTILNIITSMGLLFVLTSGLMIVFGFMGVINLAHGEFLMLGIYCGYITAAVGLSPWLSLIVAPIVMGIFGYIVERVLIRRLYNKIMECVLATWGLSIVLMQVVELVFGKGYRAIPNFTEASIPIGGGAVYPMYRIMFLITAIVLGVGFLILQRRTNVGITVRAVISNADRASTLGVNVNKVYRNCFVVGSALAGFAGALYAPCVSASSTVGNLLTINSMFAILVGGAPTVAALGQGSAILGGGSSLVSYLLDPIWGSVGLILISLFVIRLRRPAL